MPSAIDFASFAWIAAHPWLYPALESVHLVGIAIFIGSLVLVELRMLGLGAALPIAALGRFGLTVAWGGFGMAAGSGAMLFLASGEEILANRAFLLKMALLVLAGLNAALYHGRGGFGRHDATARAQTFVSLGTWLGIIICGRWIAYV